MKEIHKDLDPDKELSNILNDTGLTRLNFEKLMSCTELYLIFNESNFEKILDTLHYHSFDNFEKIVYTLNEYAGLVFPPISNNLGLREIINQSCICTRRKCDFKTALIRGHTYCIEKFYKQKDSFPYTGEVLRRLNEFPEVNIKYSPTTVEYLIEKEMIIVRCVNYIRVIRNRDIELVKVLHKHGYFVKPIVDRFLNYAVEENLVEVIEFLFDRNIQPERDLLPYARTMEMKCLICKKQNRSLFDCGREIDLSLPPIDVIIERQGRLMLAESVAQALHGGNTIKWVDGDIYDFDFDMHFDGDYDRSKENYFFSLIGKRPLNSPLYAMAFGTKHILPEERGLLSPEAMEYVLYQRRDKPFLISISYNKYEWVHESIERAISVIKNTPFDVFIITNILKEFKQEEAIKFLTKTFDPIIINNITVSNLVEAYKLLRALDPHKPVIVESVEFENPREVLALLNEI